MDLSVEIIEEMDLAVYNNIYREFDVSFFFNFKCVEGEPNFSEKDVIFFQECAIKDKKENYDILKSFISYLLHFHANDIFTYIFVKKNYDFDKIIFALFYKSEMYIHYMRGIFFKWISNLEKITSGLEQRILRLAQLGYSDALECVNNSSFKNRVIYTNDNND